MGEYCFDAGLYVYSGSARRHPHSRLQRHLRREKRLRWHIDYVLTSPGVEIVDVEVRGVPECRLNRLTIGTLPVRGFGASDCRSRCGSHLKYLGPTPWSGRDYIG